MLIRKLLSAVAVTCVVSLQLQAASDFKISPDVSLDSLTISASSTQYLVVWRDSRNFPAAQFRGASVSATGVVGPDFGISDAAGVPLENPVQQPTLAFDGGAYFLVWADNRLGGAGIRGAKVGVDTAIQIPDFLIAPTARDFNHTPQVVYTGSDYVVAWLDDAPSSNGIASQIRFVRVAINGAVGTVGSIPLATDTSTHKLESLVARPTGDVLVVFQDLGVEPNLTRGSIVGASSALLEPPAGVVLFQRGLNAPGLGVPVGAAYDNGEFQILSSHSAQIDSTVFRTRLLDNGTVLRSSTPFAEVPQGSTNLAENDFPRVLYNGNLGVREFLFLRNTQVSATAYHIYAKRVLLDGTDRDLNLPILDNATQGVLNGAVAAAINDVYLVCWMDGRRDPGQPAKQLNVFGKLVDSEVRGDESKPFLRTIARAAPSVGEAPLEVNYSAGGSTGIVDSVLWEFGDGASSNSFVPRHKYENSGTYLVVLSLLRAGLSARDFTRVYVGTREQGALGGPPQIFGGTPGPTSPGVNREVLPGNFTVNLDFTRTGNDNMRLFGYVNPNRLPVNVKGLTVSATIAGRTTTFTVDINGVFISAAGVKPVVRFDINRTTGAFAITTSQDDLRPLYEPLGAANTTTVKPLALIPVPVTFSFDQQSVSTVLRPEYSAKAGKNGRLFFNFGTVGSMDTGFFRLFSMEAKEGGKIEQLNRTGAFTLIGNMGFGLDKPFELPTSGVWTFTLGNYTESIPVSGFKPDRIGFTYNSKTQLGIDKIFYNSDTGRFGVSFRGLSLEQSGVVGFPLSNTQFVRADLAFSADLDLKDGGKFQAGDWARFARKKSTTKKWGTR